MNTNGSRARMSIALYINLSCLCILMIISNGAMAANGQISIALGFDISSGKYGTPDTTTFLSIPAICKYETDLWLIKLTVPYISITTVDGVLPDIGPVAHANTAGSKVTTSGLGDVVAATTYYAVPDKDGSVGLNITGEIKLPTANKVAGLGTGETDYAVKLDVYKAFNVTTLYAAVGRKILGSSAMYPLHDVFYGSVGASYQASDKLSMGVNLDAAQGSYDSLPGPLEVSFNFTRKIDIHKKLEAYLLKGLSNGSPDIGLGGMMYYLF